jgi:hypothetical protein
VNFTLVAILSLIVWVAMVATEQPRERVPEVQGIAPRPDGGETITFRDGTSMVTGPPGPACDVINNAVVCSARRRH